VRVHPAVKVSWLVATCAATLALTSAPALLAVLALLWATPALAGGWAPGRRRPHPYLPALLTVARMSLPFCLALLVLQVALHRSGPVAFVVPWVRLAVYTQALQRALLGCLRVQCLAVAGTQFWLWTHPTDLAIMLMGWGVPYRYAFLPTVAFRALPLLAHELEQVLDGQELLGLEIRRGWTQIRNLPSLVVPFCLRTLRVGNDMALAMELRGYGAGSARTHLRPVDAHWWDYALAAGVLAGLALAIVVAAGR